MEQTERSSAAAARRSAERDNPGRRVYALAAGYLAVWSLFSLVLTVLQRVLADNPRRFLAFVPKNA